MRLFLRLLVVLALLAVPLGLAVASQALADRPGPPSVPAEPVVIEEAGPPPPAPADPAAPATAPGPAPSSPAPQPAPQPLPPSPPGGPQVVDPAPIPLDDDTDDTDDQGDLDD